MSEDAIKNKLQSDVVNFLKSGEQEKAGVIRFIMSFLNEAEKQNIIGIQGHRSVGGVRISLYNAVDSEMVNYISEFISKLIPLRISFPSTAACKLFIFNIYFSL